MPLPWDESERVLICEHETKEGVYIAACRGNVTKQQSGAIVNAANHFLWHNGGVAAAIRKAAHENFQSESEAWVKDNGPLTVGHTAAITSFSPTAKCIHVVGPIWRQPLAGEFEVSGTIESVEGEACVFKIESSFGEGEPPAMADVKIYRTAAGFVLTPGAKVKALGKMKDSAFVVRYITGEGHEVRESDEELLKAAVTSALRKADEEGLGSICIPAISSGIFGFPLDACAKVHVQSALDFAQTAKSVKHVCFIDFDEKASAALGQALSQETGAKLLL